QDIRYAYVVGDSNKIEARAIQVLSNNDGKNFVVTDGLKAGERIAVEGVGMTVRAGTVINPVDAAKREEQKAQQQQK
ncbi:MAG: efflux RND transporter periplasmic adaptor subunit, partial [Bacteroidales bacterium]|nr:efflux RND transporter periplasmic adaptor subunit [Bacteroidales bacterium]